MTGPVVDTDDTAADGYFYLQDDDWQAGRYYLTVLFEHDGYPLEHLCTSLYGASGWSVNISTSFTLSSTYNYLPKISINSAGDSTSLAGGIASVWADVYLSVDALQQEGVYYQRRENGSPNAYDEVLTRMGDISPDPSNADCDDDEITIDDNSYREGTMLHEFGHILHGRAIGCSGNAPEFPDYVADLAHTFHGAEGATIPEAIASFTRLLALRDPDTTTGNPANVFATCSDHSSYDNDNDAASMRNVWLAMWEFVDTSTNGADAYQDYIDLTYLDLLGALLDWELDTGSQGENHTADEFYLSNTFVACDRDNKNEDCDPGEICHPTDSKCYDGDPHGGNIRDWLYHLAARQSESETNYWKTLVSSPCIGSADDSYPFEGGYRTD